MSRIGKLPITLPKGVEVKLGQDIVEVKGPKGSLTTPLCDLLDYEVTADHVTVTRKDLEDRATAQQHGLRRTLLANCVEGVTKGFSKTMEVIGVGFKVAVKGNIVELPKGIEAKAEGTKLTISGIDKQLVGEMCAKIRRLRKPEPYKGKGIKYENEIIRRKAGKSGAKGK